MIIINKRNGKCQSCSESVAIGKGFAYLNGNRWFTACASTACHKRLGVTPPSYTKAGPVVRKLHADGRVEMPFDRDALPLIKGMPSARWNPGEKVWTVSTDVKDLPRVIEVADKLKLEVPNSMRKAADHGTEDTRAAEERAKEFEAPDGRKLFEFQKEGVAFLARHDNALLGDDMGLGKTIQVIAAVPDNSAIIVICPACVKYNWKNEFNSWRPEYTVHVMEGRGSFRIPKPGEVVIINYDILPSHFEIVKEKDGNKYKYINNPNVSEQDKELLSKAILVCDEIHLCKNYKAKRSGRVKALGTLVDKMWGLTGTPLPNRPQDLYGVLDVLNIRVLGGWNKFLSLFNGYKTRFGGYEFGEPTPEVAERLRRSMIRRLKSEVLKDLPPKRHQMITVNGIDSKLGKKLDEYLVHMCVRQGLIKKPEGMDELTKKFITENMKLAHEIAPCLTAKLPEFSEFSAMRALLAESRIPVCIEMAEQYEEQDQPVVFFSAHKKPVEALAKREGWALITGDTSPANRTKIVEEFQAGKLKGLAATIKAAGVGITLTRATEAVFIDYDWTPANNIQAEDRLARIGQTESVLIRVLQSHHPLDQHIQSLLLTKILWAQKALDEEVDYTQPKIINRETVKIQEESDESLAERLSKLEDKKAESERQFFLGRLQGILERERGKACLPEPKLTDSRKKLIIDALDYMCYHCDGALTKDGIGFNRPDAAIGHWLNRSGMQDEVAFRVAERILSRYARQLSEEFNEIWLPEMEVA